MRKHVLAALASAAVMAVVLWLAFAERPVPLVPWTAPEYPPVKADPETRPLTLSGLFDARPESGNGLRRLHNDLAKAHDEVLVAYEGGRASQREVEALALDVLVVRWRLGLIEEGEMHRRMAELFDRERRRLESLHASGLAGPDQVERARLYVARERHAAGLPVEGGYEAMRQAYLAAVRRRGESLHEIGLANRETLRLEYQTLEREFPPTKPE
jgi:3-deoxy-D-arabino-heptulosonate 7-phosphate (DAHP) synthase class II